MDNLVTRLSRVPLPKTQLSRVVETSIMLANQGEHESYCGIGERNGGRKGHSMYMEVRSPNDLIVKTKWDILDNCYSLKGILKEHTANVSPA